MAWRARSVDAVDNAPRAEFNAPLFRTLVEQLETQDRWVVLDLGAACTQTLALFGGYRCRLDIADISDGLTRINAVEDPGALRDAADSLLPRWNHEATDLVLCWDLLNYLERPALRALMSRIAARARNDTLVHALIVYSQAQMPVEPGRYVPLDDLSLVDAEKHTGLRPAPRYSPDDLRHCLPEYVIEKAMLLGNGMQEFLFRL